MELNLFNQTKILEEFKEIGYEDEAAMVLCELKTFEKDQEDSETTSLNRKNKRERITPKQKMVLETVFVTQKLPSYQLRDQLSQSLGMSPKRVQVWFQNKRAKIKKSEEFTVPEGEGVGVLS